MKYEITNQYNDDSDPEITIELNSDDMYSLDCTLAPLLLAAVKQFKEVANGCPAKLTGYWNDETIETTIEEGMAAWHAILDDMIYAFEIEVLCGMEDWDTTDYERVERGLAYFGEYYRDLWL